MNTRKAILLSAIILVSLTCFVIFLLNQNIMKPYYISTPSNEPGLRMGSQVYASNMFEPEQMDFVVFNFDDPQFGEAAYIFRLVAKAGDTVFIENGTLFVNGENMDEGRNLKHMYQIHDNVYFQLEEKLKPHDYIHPPGGFRDIDSVLVHLEDTIAKAYSSRRVVEPRTESDHTIEQQYDKFWNRDKFGQYIVPEGTLFVMGDNRDNAFDSRYIGPIPEEDVIGVIKSN